LRDNAVKVLERSRMLVGIAMGYGLDGWGSVPGKCKQFSLLHSVHNGSVVGPVSYLLGTGMKRPGREADHSSKFNTEVKNGGAILPLPHASSWRDA
jgi:hypothetical protein